MKIAYWSNSRRSGVTSNLAAVGLTGVLSYPFKITMFENHYNIRGISSCLFPECMIKGVAEKNIYCLGRGVFGHPMSQCNQKAYHIRKNYAVVEVMEDSLFYVPQLARKQELFDYEFRCNLLPIIERYQKQDEIVFIDTSLKDSISSKTILSEADFVVVTLRQNMHEIQDFFQNYSSLIQKAFFIIGRYNKNCHLTLKNILSEFGIRRDRIGIIPHSDQFQMVAESGRMIEFISSHFHCSYNEEEKFFIQELKKTTFLLMQYAVFNNQRANYW